MEFGKKDLRKFLKLLRARDGVEYLASELAVIQAVCVEMGGRKEVLGRREIDRLVFKTTGGLKNELYLNAFVAKAEPVWTWF